MNKAIRITENGAPEVMQYIDVDVPAPNANEVQIRHKACGLNYIDVYFRTGLYKQALPAGLGMEGAGIVEAIGDSVTHLKVGDRVAYAGGPPGAYAQCRNVPAHVLVKIPDDISFEVAAAVMLQGLTVQYLFRRTKKLEAGQTILFHAAAGGVGLLASQWARALGVTMIGTVGSEEKAALAKSHGCTHVINYNTADFVARVKELTEGKGVPVVYDSIGKDTFKGSLDCLQPLGLMVSFGNASGAVPDFNLSELASRGSLFITRPSVAHYTAVRADLELMAAELFDMILSKKIIVNINQRYKLADVAQAHRDLEARKTTGSTFLLVD